MTFFKITLLLGILLVCFSCGEGAKIDFVPVEYGEQVEVSPGKFITVKRADQAYEIRLPNGKLVPNPIAKAEGERSELKIDWENIMVAWKGKEKPYCIREFNGILYMFGYDRDTYGPTKLLYRYFRNEGGKFVEIKPDEFPKQIATQNMGFSSYKTNEEIKMALALDPADPDFGWSPTAHVWYHLATGKQRWESPHIIPKEVLQDYLQKYKPIRLTKIVQGDDAKQDGTTTSPAEKK